MGLCGGWVVKGSDMGPEGCGCGCGHVVWLGECSEVESDMDLGWSQGREQKR